MTELLGRTEEEALAICRGRGVEPELRRTAPPRPFAGEVWRVVQQRGDETLPVLVLAACRARAAGEDGP